VAEFLQPNTNTFSWNPHGELRCDSFGDGAVQTPALGLGHQLAHLIIHVRVPFVEWLLHSERNQQSDNELDRVTIQDPEAVAAVVLGEEMGISKDRSRTLDVRLLFV
jgi:hypothetical protein